MTHLQMAVRHVLRQDLKKMRDLCCVVVLFSVLAIVCAALVGGAVRAQQDRVEQATGSQWVIVNNAGSGAAKTPNIEAVEEISALPAVSAVLPWDEAGLLQEDGNPLPDEWQVVWAAAEIPGAHPEWNATLHDGELQAGEIALPDALDDHDLSELLGTQLSFTHQVSTSPGRVVGESVQLTVAALYDADAPSNDGPGRVYASSSDVLSWAADNAGLTPSAYGEAGYRKLYVAADSAADVSTVHRELQRAGYSAESWAAASVAVEGFGGIIASASRFLPFLAALLAVVLGIACGIQIPALRARSIALARAFGESMRSAVASILAEALVIAVGLSVVALAAGAVIILAVGVCAGGATLGGLPVAASVWDTVRAAPWWLGILPVILVPLGAALGSARRVRKIDPYRLLCES